MAEDLDEEYDDDSDDGEGGGGGGKKKLLLIVVLPVLLLIGALAGAYFAGLADPVLAMFSGGGEEQAQEAACIDVKIFFALFPPGN